MKNIKREKDLNMDDYFEAVLTGYRSETGIDNSMLDKLPFFIKVTLMGNIVNAFEVIRNNGEEMKIYDIEVYTFNNTLSECIQMITDKINKDVFSNSFIEMYGKYMRERNKEYL